MEPVSTAAQLSEHLEREIEAGRLLPGERLAPVREMAERLGLAPNTVASAYRALGDRGLLVGRGRAGTFVADTGPQLVATPVIPDGVEDLALGNPDPDLLPDLSPWLASADPPDTLYGDVAVLPELEEAARAWLADLPGGFAVVNGALDGVERVLSARLQPGSAVAVEDPGWPATFDLLRALRMRPVPVAVDEDGPVAEDLERVAGRVDAVVITSRMQNPTGACVSRRRAEEIGEVLARHPELLIVEDDHAPAIAGCDLQVVGPGRDRWAVVQSFSKSLAPDLRLATVAGDDETIDLVAGRQAVGPGWVSHLIQRLAASMISDAAVRSLLERATRAYAERRSGLAGALADRGIASHGRSGLNLWVPVPDEGAVVARCLDAGFAVRAGEAFRLESEPAVRVTTARLDPDRSEAVATAIADALATTRTATRAG